MGELDTYRARRHGGRTPEPLPGPEVAPPTSQGQRFVVQEHHARALHWDLRLERDGVLVSWAVPKGLPLDPGVRRLAVPTEDHPLEYAAFSGEIPVGEYGAGTVAIWDEGTYDCETWSEREIRVVLHGARLSGRYLLVGAGRPSPAEEGRRRWMVQRLGEADAHRVALPKDLLPMLAVSGDLPPSDGRWAFELKWDGVRALATIDGGRITLTSRNARDVTISYPELRPLGEALAGHQVVLDGEIVAISSARPDFGRLQQRMHVTDPGRARRLAERVPVTLLVFDVLYLDGVLATRLPYDERRRLLESLHLEGPAWATPPSFTVDGSSVLRAAAEQGLEGVVAKRRDAPYQPGRRSGAFVKVKLVRTQEVVIGGYSAGRGRRQASLGALLVGVPHGSALRYVGKVGTGFDHALLADLMDRLPALVQSPSPFAGRVPGAAGATWVAPVLVGEVAFTEWTAEGRLRHPSWRGLRADKDPAQVVVEPR